MFKLLILLLILALLVSCSAPRSGARKQSAPRFAIAIHGGAGVIDRNVPEAERAAYIQGLDRALRDGRDRLARGESAMTVVEAVVRILEDDPNFNAGKGAVFTEDGRHELDASIMDGRASPARCWKCEQ